jgi:hypothetical protein
MRPRQPKPTLTTATGEHAEIAQADTDDATASQENTRSLSRNGEERTVCLKLNAVFTG